VNIEIKNIDKLEYCPFCGSDEPIAVNPDQNHPWFVDCPGCGAAGPAGETKDEAEKNWNLRS